MELARVSEGLRTRASASRAQFSQREAHVPRGLTSVLPGLASRGFGAHVEDLDGRGWIDFAGGIGALNVGQSHPRVVRAIQDQAERYLHTAAQVLMPDVYVQLAARLNGLTPGTFAKKTILLNSGAEAIENAVKIARAATGRPGVLVFEGAFHGRTLLTMTLTDRTHPYKDGFGPFAPAVYRSPYAYPYRCPAGSEQDVCAAWALDRVESLIAGLDPDAIAAILVEPILGEGGFVVPPPAFLRGLESIARQHRIVLIFDEIQTGIGRTGRMFACEHANVAPDLMVLGKSLAAGLPLAAVTGRAEIMDVPGPGALGGTSAGNPLGCVAALAVLDVIEDEQLLARAADIGRRARAYLEHLADRFDGIGEVRGVGAMQAIELVKDRSTKEADPELTSLVLSQAHERGLVILRAGSRDNVIRLLIPLVISDSDLEVGLEVLGASFQSAHQRSLRIRL